MLPYILTNDRLPNIDGTLPAEQVLAEAGYYSPSPLLPPPRPRQSRIHKNASSDRFMDTFMLFSNLTGIGLNEQDFFVDGYQVNPWELYRTVLIRYACMIIRFLFPCLRDFIFLGMNGEWPMAGVDLGFHPVSCGDPYPSAVAHQLHQLYQNTFAFRLGVYSRHHYCNQLEYVHTTGQRSSMAQPQALQ
jgi:hypothetical protein